MIFRNSPTSNTSAPLARKRSLKAQLSKQKINLSVGLTDVQKQLPLNNKNHDSVQSSVVETSNVTQIKTSSANATTVQDIDIINDTDDSDKKETSGIIDDSQGQSKITDSTHDVSVRDNLDKIKIKICQNCNTHHLEGTCPVEFPHYVITDALDRHEWAKKYKTAHDKQFGDGNEDSITDIINNEINKLTYSVLSLPDCLSLSLVQDELRVFAKTNFEPFTQFGPLVGKVVKEKDIPEDIEMKYIWEAFDSTGNAYFNTENVSLSNWVKYIRPAPDKEDKNITVISRDKKLYFISLKLIKSGEELLFWQFSTSVTSKKKMEKSGKYSFNPNWKLKCSLRHLNEVDSNKKHVE